MANKNPFATALGSAKGQQSSRTFTEALGSSSGGASSSAANFSSEQHQFPNLPNLDQYGGTNGPKQDFSNWNQPQSEFAQQRQLEEQKKKAEYDRKRAELHKKINPVDTLELFNAREEQTKKKIERIRKDLKNLAREISKFHKEIDITLMGRVTNTGLDGIGDENFFDKLRAFIILLTQRVRSARTWAQQQKKKSAKKRAKRGKGLGKEMAHSSGFEQRANMEEFFNNERGDNWGE